MSVSNDVKPENYQINAKICRLVEQYPCMYDRTHSRYLKKDVVDKAWVKIAKEMDDSIPSCKERWRNIRTSFARSINVNKIPASANRTKPYYLHEELQFLAQHITPGIPVARRGNTNYSSAGEESIVEVSLGEESLEGYAAMAHDEEDSQGQQSSIDGNEENDTKSQKAQQESVEEENEAETNNQLQQWVTPIGPPKKRLRTIDVTESDVKIDVKPVELPTPSSDFDAIFLQGLLTEMKVMNFYQKIQFKRRIYEIMGEIFDDPHSTNTSSRAQSTPGFCATVDTPTVNVLNGADLAMLRRLNSLIGGNSAVGPTSTVTAMPKNVGCISSTVRSTPPVSATVAVQRGALTRSNSNMLRVTMLNPLLPSSSSSSTSSIPQPQVLKQEADD